MHLKRFFCQLLRDWFDLQPFLKEARWTCDPQEWQSLRVALLRLKCSKYLTRLFFNFLLHEFLYWLCCSMVFFSGLKERFYLCRQIPKTNRILCRGQQNCTCWFHCPKHFDDMHYQNITTISLQIFVKMFCLFQLKIHAASRCSKAMIDLEWLDLWIELAGRRFAFPEFQIEEKHRTNNTIILKHWSTILLVSVQWG